MRAQIATDTKTEIKNTDAVLYMLFTKRRYLFNEAGGGGESATIRQENQHGRLDPPGDAALRETSTYIQQRREREKERERYADAFEGGEIEQNRANTHAEESEREIERGPGHSCRCRLVCGTGSRGRTPSSVTDLPYSCPASR
jgi:hypothetical protein